MRLFLSYASKDRRIAEDVYLALVGDGHDVFYDQPSLIPGENSERRIRAALENADAIVFLISPHSVEQGSYALTELKIARQIWKHPEGHVLPTMVESTPFEQIPAYLRAVTILQPEGNTAAEVADTLRRWRSRTGTASERTGLLARVGGFFTIVLGGLLMTTALGTLFSRVYPRVEIDTGLASLLLLVGMLMVLAIRRIWRLVSRGSR